MHKGMGMLVLLLAMACSKSGGGAPAQQGHVEGSVSIAGKAVEVKGCTATTRLGDVEIHFQLADGRELVYTDDFALAADDMGRGSPLACEGMTSALTRGSSTGGNAFAKGNLAGSCKLGGDAVDIKLEFECGNVPAESP